MLDKNAPGSAVQPAIKPSAFQSGGNQVVCTAAPSNRKSRPKLVTSAEPTPVCVTKPMDLAPLETALRFLKDRSLAYSETSKRYHLHHAATHRWEELTGNQLQRELKSWMLGSWGHTAKVSTFKQMVAEIEINAPLWQPKRHPGKLVVRNGVLDFSGKTVALLPHDSTMQFEYSLDVEYRPDAKCPKFHDLLNQAVADDDQELIQKWVGSALAGHNQSQVALVLVGNPGTGKGTLVNLITNLIGVRQTAELRVDKFNERFELSAYLGKRLLVAPEIPSDLLSLHGIGRLKALVGQDRMEAEVKFQNRRVAMEGDFHVILHGNRLCAQPWSADVDAFRRRLLIVDFNRTQPVRPVPNLAGQIWCEEAAGILAWAVAGVRKYYADVATHGTIPLTVSQQQRVDAVIPPAPPRHSPQPVTPADEGGFLRWLSLHLQRFGIRLERVSPGQVRMPN